jgi:acyl-CoA thioesterase
VMPYVEGVTPVFTRHFRVRWRRGQPPFTGDHERQHVLELGLGDDGPTREEHLMAFADFIPPIGLCHLQVPAPSSTLTWMMEVFLDRFDDLPLDGWLVEAEMSAARGGFTHQSVTLWAPDGRLAALGHQTMLIFG